MTVKGWELSEGHTAIVGRNGSGKSNLFEALEFVLCSPRYSQLRAEERHRLLSGDSLSAHVEVVLENRGGRLPKDLGEEVVLRRCIGAKKDEYFVNRKRVAKKEVESLLEHAGVQSTSKGATYAVRQGSVSALCAAKDTERLELLKEVGGAGTYEAKRRETMAILDATATKVKDASSDLHQVEARLQELEGEKEELQAYERVERRRRALTYALYDAELAESSRELEEAEATADNDDTRHELWWRKGQCRERVRECRERIERASSAYAASNDAFGESRLTKSKLATRSAKLKSELAELELKISKDAVVKLRLKRALREVSRNINELGAVEKTAFKTTTARRDAAAAFSRARTARKEAAGLSTLIANAVQKRSALSSRARLARRDVERCEEEVRRCTAKVREARFAFRRTAPLAARAGLELLDNADEQLKAKIRGPLACHVKLIDEKYRTAVEVAAGHQLWHVIVDDDDAAADAAKLLERDGRGGRLTLLPLNRLRAPARLAADIISAHDEDVVPLLETAVAFDNEHAYRLPLKIILGDKLLARDLETAANRATALSLDAVTLEGDKVSRRGAIEGGSCRYDDDPSKSALLAYSALKTTLDDLEAARRMASETVARADQLSKHDTIEAEKELAHLEERRELSIDAAMSAQRDQDRLARNCRKIEAAARGLDDDDDNDQRRQFDAALKSRDELRSKLGLSVLNDEPDEEEEENEDEDDDEKPGEEVAIAADATFAVSADHRQERADEIRRELIALEEEALAEDSSSNEASRGQTEAELEAARIELERASAAEAAVDDALAEAVKATEHAAARIATLSARREERVRKMRQVGALPAADIEAFKELPVAKLVKLLSTCNKERAKYNHVNKKALDQYVNFSDRRRDLTEAKTELDETRDALANLLSTLDDRKDRTILDTFETVASHFATIFSQLEPDGRAELQLVRNEPGGDAHRLSTFSGVAIHVSYTDADKPKHIAQLSGGQKALVSLALLFALHAADPAPFYLCDEIDAALDADKRKKLATLVTDLAQKDTQIITTTFSSELVHVADTHFGISARNGFSTIEPIGKEDALAFVADARA